LFDINVVFVEYYLQCYIFILIKGDLKCNIT